MTRTDCEKEGPTIDYERARYTLPDTSGKSQQDKALLKFFSVCKYPKRLTLYVLTASFSPVSLVQDLAYRILEAVKVRSLNIFDLNRALRTGRIELSKS